jgi:hypothetical protein
MDKGLKLAAFCSILLGSMTSMAAAQGTGICKAIDWGLENPPKGAFPQLVAQDDGTALPRNQIHIVNNSATPLSFRIGALHRSLPLRVVYFDAAGGVQDYGPIVYPRSSVDVSRANFGVKYYCGSESTGECANDQPTTILCRMPDGSIQSGYRLWIDAWWALLYPPTNDLLYASSLWANNLDGHIWNALGLTRTTLIDVDKPRTYRIQGGYTGGAMPSKLFVDGQDQGILDQAITAKFYTGMKFEIEAPPGQPSSVGYAFIQ